MEKNEKTKYKLAEAMKECMKTSKVDAITVKQLAEKCGLTRQTFYRNFLDKFDLINWYFGKILDQSFEHMGRGTSVYDALQRGKSGKRGGRPSEQIYINPAYYQWKEEQRK